MSEKVSVAISRELYDEIRKRVELSKDEFKNVEEYVEFVLTEVVGRDSEYVYTSEDEKEIERRLRNMGYL